MDRSNKITTLALGIIAALYGGYAIAQTQTDSATTEENGDQEIVVVTGTALTIDRLELEQSPKDNPTLSEAIKHEPRVGVDDAQNSLQGGDLTPEEISLSGARPHQTKYTIDGVGVNNNTTFGGANDLPGSLSSGHTSGYFIDTNLIDSIEVLDHNIGAEYGGFTGGVVNAHVRKPTDEFVIDYNYRMNDSSWNSKQKVGINFADDYGTPIDGSGYYQPNYQKRMHSLHIGGAISETQKLALNVSHQASDIPMANGKDSDQTMDNLFLTHIWESGAWQTTTDFRYTGHHKNTFLNDANSNDAVQEGSDSVVTHAGMGGTFKLDYMFDSGHWQTTLAYDHLIDERESDHDYFGSFFVFGADGLEMYNQGSYGNLKQSQDSYLVKSVYYSDPTYIGNVELQPSIGIEATHQQSTVDRANDFVAYQYLDFGSPSISTLTRYNASNYDVDAQQYSLFADSKMQWDRWGLYLGGRVDHMSVFEQTVFSPRIATSWDFDLVNTNRITLGANRYYSSNMLGFALQAEQDNYLSRSSSCTPNDGDWNNLDESNLTCASTETFDGAALSSADVPYSDELTASWDINVSNFAFDTTYIYRMQRDGITFSEDSDLGIATIHNNIESDDHIISLEVATRKPYEVAGGYFSANWRIAYNYRRGHGDLKGTYGAGNNLNGGYQDEWVMVDGELVRYSEMDVSGYQSPIKSSLDLNMFWANAGVVWNNRVNYQQGKKDNVYLGVESVEIDGQPETVNSLQSVELDDLVTWDMAINWTPTQLNNHLILGLSVTNILNTQEVISTSGIHVDGLVVPDDYYNSGRQIWLNVNLRN
ncbi:hypothetical protein VHA01S_012_00100 [Vibrio halioticoli NBRC 102217]|uniref:TonB-dependent receptor plug domain-containing protein n=1 Tax=Vibrio halioticoli NBRC 102217 TaxID=1219072 RepID=V5F1A8_9VIBR|nr:TonB-dependent receptor plug domain-containing protein [Vibrio halioticoli]GAD88894.1 hypothetical protein VHA01S_012_00100 [Vibrio halioticoli NBRC 102217]